MLGLGTTISKTGKLGVHDLGIVTSNLVLKHNYDLSSVQPLSDGAAYFDGDDYIALSTKITLEVETVASSITFWARRSTISGWNTVLGDRSSSGKSWILFNDSATSLYAESKTEGDTSIGTLVGANANEWHHYAVVFNGDKSVTFYQNGILRSTSGVLDDDIDIDQIGLGYTNAAYFNGYLCNIGIWNGAALTQAQVKSIMWKKYSDLTSSETDDLVSWWNLDEETATDGTAGSGGVKDYHSTNHGTLS